MLLDHCWSVCPVLSVMLVYCGQTVGRIKMKLGKQLGLGPGPLCYMGTQLPSPKTGTAPNFRPMSIVSKWSPISATAEHLFKFST